MAFVISLFLSTTSPHALLAKDIVVTTFFWRAFDVGDSHGMFLEAELNFDVTGEVRYKTTLGLNPESSSGKLDKETGFAIRRNLTSLLTRMPIQQGDFSDSLQAASKNPSSELASFSSTETRLIIVTRTGRTEMVFYGLQNPGNRRELVQLGKSGVAQLWEEALKRTKQTGKPSMLAYLAAIRPEVE